MNPLFGGREERHIGANTFLSPYLPLLPLINFSLLVKYYYICVPNPHCPPPSTSNAFNTLDIRELIPLLQRYPVLFCLCLQCSLCLELLLSTASVDCWNPTHPLRTNSYLPYITLSTITQVWIPTCASSPLFTWLQTNYKDWWRFLKWQRNLKSNFTFLPDKYNNPLTLVLKVVFDLSLSS